MGSLKKKDGASYDIDHQYIIDNMQFYFNRQLEIKEFLYKKSLRKEKNVNVNKLTAKENSNMIMKRPLLLSSNVRSGFLSFKIEHIYFFASVAFVSVGLAFNGFGRNQHLQEVNRLRSNSDPVVVVLKTKRRILPFAVIGPPISMADLVSFGEIEGQPSRSLGEIEGGPSRSPGEIKGETSRSVDSLDNNNAIDLAANNLAQSNTLLVPPLFVGSANAMPLHFIPPAPPLNALDPRRLMVSTFSQANTAQKENPPLYAPRLDTNGEEVDDFIDFLSHALPTSNKEVNNNFKLVNDNFLDLDKKVKVLTFLLSDAKIHVEFWEQQVKVAKCESLATSTNQLDAFNLYSLNAIKMLDNASKTLSANLKSVIPISGKNEVGHFLGIDIPEGLDMFSVVDNIDNSFPLTLPSLESILSDIPNEPVPPFKQRTIELTQPNKEIEEELSQAKKLFEKIQEKLSQAKKLLEKPIETFEVEEVNQKSVNISLNKRKFTDSKNETPVRLVTTSGPVHLVSLTESPMIISSNQRNQPNTVRKLIPHLQETSETNAGLQLIAYSQATSQGNQTGQLIQFSQNNQMPSFLNQGNQTGQLIQFSQSNQMPSFLNQGNQEKITASAVTPLKRTLVRSPFLTKLKTEQIKQGNIVLNLRLKLGVHGENGTACAKQISANLHNPEIYNKATNQLKIEQQQFDITLKEMNNQRVIFKNLFETHYLHVKDAQKYNIDLRNHLEQKKLKLDEIIENALFKTNLEKEQFTKQKSDLELGISYVEKVLIPQYENCINELFLIINNNNPTNFDYGIYFEDSYIDSLGFEGTCYALKKKVSNQGASGSNT